MIRKLPFLTMLISTMLACSSQPPTGTTTEDLITVCTGGPCTITPQPPATSWYMWHPSYRIYPYDANLRFCDARWPPGIGEVAIYDLPFAPDSTGHLYPQTTSQCAVLEDSVNGVLTGGWFDWSTFQQFGWATPSGSIRAMQLGPGMQAVFSNHALDVNRPDGCAVGPAGEFVCIGIGGNPTFVTDVPDVRTVFPGFPTFNMASLHITRQ